VRAEVTEERPGYLRADAVEIRSASPDRVVAPCRFAGPDRCGGCDFQHASPAAQRELKTAVVVEQLTRLGRLTAEEIDKLGVRVEPLPGGDLGWRSRLRYTVDAAGHAGLLKHRSHEVVAIEQCLIATPAIRALPLTAQLWPADDAVEVVATSGGEVSVTGVRARRPSPRAGAATTRSGSEAHRVGGSETRRVSGPETVTEAAIGRSWRLDPATFWQVHPAAPATFVEVVMRLLDVAPGERAWDLYGGAGLFAAALAEAVGRSGSVTLVESDQRAVVAARTSLADLPQVTIAQSTVERMRVRGRPDVIVLDPPRSGAGARVVRSLIAAAPRAIAYVACDPAAFARDVATFRAAGWQLSALRGFDAFPMTHHLELIGLLEPAAG